VEEAGGRVSDVDGAELDFLRGRTLAANRGVVATSGGALHDRVLGAIQQVRGG
jgi:3'(2'), 5'-bisphosphate nucleotidase